MKKSIFIILLFLFGLFFFTNPSESDFKFKVINEYNIYKDIYSVPDTSATIEAYELGNKMGSILIENSLEKNTSSKNFILFSVGYYRGQYCGFGILNSISLSQKFKDNLINNFSEDVRE